MNPVLALIITNIIWGAAPPIFKYALTNIPPFTLAFIRFFGASFLFLPFVFRLRPQLTLRDWIEITICGFLAVTINIAFFFLGLQRAHSINAAIIGSSAPVFLYFASIVILKERPKIKVFLGMLLGLIGVMTIIMSPILFDGQRFAAGEIAGNLFFVVAALSLFVFDPLVRKDLVTRVNPYVVTYFSFVIGSLPFMPFMLGELRSWSPASLNTAGMVGIIYGIFFSSAVAYFLYSYGLSKIKAQEVGIFNYIDPVTAVIVAIPLIGEYPNTYFLLGATAVFVGIFIAEGRLHWHPIHRLRL